MIVERIIYVVFGVMLLAGSVGAVDLTASNISTSNTGWLTATSDGSSQSIITVYALNSSASPPGVSGAIVDFSLDPASAGMGTFFPASVTTGSEGKATAVFGTGKKSGTAVIRATISYSDGTTTPVTVQTNQKIDHSVPQYANYSFLPSVTVGTITPISVLLTDQFNNPVDSNNPSGGHLVTLATTSSPGGEGFQNGSLFVDHIVLAPDAAGRVSASYRVSSIAGKNYIMLLPLGNINDPPQYITGTGLTMPAFITQTFPLPNTLPADADPSHYFTIDYTVTDVYGNPVNTTLLFTADDGTSSVKVTNPVTGKVRARFWSQGYYRGLYPQGVNSRQCIGGLP